MSRLLSSLAGPDPGLTTGLIVLRAADPDAFALALAEAEAAS